MISTKKNGGFYLLKTQHRSMAVALKLFGNMHVQFKVELLLLCVNVFHLSRFVLEWLLNCDYDAT